ncbi:unnamed protein product [Prorocentrum cordatum]|uniref:Subtilisin n=1 Tax=Prorocentrum cordatum TaxID=2364126 RepID=A0ABN9YGU4_9DINO|nr:unnamed protein product [Polarella glacialis]
MVTGCSAEGSGVSPTAPSCRSDFIVVSSRSSAFSIGVVFVTVSPFRSDLISAVSSVKADCPAVLPARSGFTDIKLSIGRTRAALGTNLNSGSSSWCTGFIGVFFSSVSSDNGLEAGCISASSFNPSCKVATFCSSSFWT